MSRHHLCSVFLMLACCACGEPAGPGLTGEERIVFAHDAVLYSMRPDGTDRRLLSPPVDSGPLGPIAWLLPVTNAAGTRIAFEYDGDIRTLTPNGTGLTSVTSDGYAIPEEWPSWSPNGDRLVVQNGAYLHHDLFIMDVHGQHRIQLTGDTTDDLEPAWSPDGGRIAFSSDRDSTYGIYTISPDGTDLTRVTPYSVTAYAPVWSPAGDAIAFFGADDSGSGTFIIGADGAGLTRLANIFTYSRPTWAPDGRRLAFSANAGQHSKIFVINRDGTDLTVITPPNDADYDPAWVPAGR